MSSQQLLLVLELEPDSVACHQMILTDTRRKANRQPPTRAAGGGESLQSRIRTPHLLKAGSEQATPNSLSRPKVRLFTILNVSA